MMELVLKAMENWEKNSMDEHKRRWRKDLSTTLFFSDELVAHLYTFAATYVLYSRVYNRTQVFLKSQIYFG